MAPLRSIITLSLALAASAFAPSKTAISKPTSLKVVGVDPKVYEDAVADWKRQFPEFVKYGWGPTVQAEKWNGRHAMFGWFFICTCAYLKGHGLLPDAATTVDFKVWGTLATISGKETISMERAAILIANVHFFGVSLMAAMCPPPFGDSLFIDPSHSSYEANLERNKSGFGYLPAMKLGITEEAEIINGRLAMLGIAALLMATAIEGKPTLDIVNEWVGGAYY